MQSNINTPNQGMGTPLQGTTPQFTADKFRSHWDDNFAQSGGNFDDYAPAYLYGAGLTSRYSGHAWADIEPAVRSAWEEQYPESAWERFKAAIRHGWERATS